MVLLATLAQYLTSEQLRKAIQDKLPLITNLPALNAVEEWVTNDVADTSETKNKIAFAKLLLEQKYCS
ncbi:hypothetical protein [Legionella tunisiensis]|uniref:hypothetical protein n=1 Tax=Legionella tunisiensis TaxID=1034944 RepID=UPI0002F1081D|nr:hypothetical protein [Legionella tunisiensis]